MQNLNSISLGMVFRSLLLLLALSTSSLFAQTQHHHTERCGHVAALEQLRQEDPQVDARIADMKRQVNQWIAENPEGASNRAVVTIPVHVIIVHNGEAVGSGRNLSVAQIQSQIDVLNEDFRRLNADASNTPSAFVGVAADCEIEFCLASVDPNGNPTNGITRYQHSSGTASNSALENTIKPATSWGKTNYLNMWSARLSGVLGYAYFPNTVPSNRDGVVIGDQYFGRPSSGSPYDGGRTATHEVGHWLALEHIWGDGGCGVDDGIGDTPTSGGSYGGCPSFPQTSCGSSDMFMNYMDYVNDDCMNMFTAGQKAVMVGVLNSSRSSILTAAATVCNVSSSCTVTVPTGLNSSSVTNTTATLGWNAVTNAASYNVRAREVGTTTWSGGNTSSTTINFTGLVACTDYEFQVEAVCADTSISSGYSSSTTFQTTGCSSTCDVPTGLAADTSIAVDTVLLSWNAAAGATAYIIQARQVGSSTWTTGTTAATSVNYTGLSACTQYEFQVATICSADTSAFSSIFTFTSGGCSTGPGGYCASNGQTTQDEWIETVVIGTINNNSGDDGGYADFSAISANMQTGATYNVTLTPGFAGQTYNEYWRIWIDLNQDQDFLDAGELVYDAGTGSTSTVSGSFTLPATASTGNTRMRVQMKYVGTNGVAPTSCESFQYGEVEDYTVNISGGTTSCDVPQNLAVSSVSDSTLALTWDAVASADSYYVDIRVYNSGAGFTTFAVAGNGINFTGISPCTTYEFQVEALCGSTTSGYSTSDTVTSAGCGGSSGCDELDNTNGGSLVLYTPSGGIWGYVAGHNGYGDLAKADYFNYAGTGDQISGAYFRFGYAFVGNAANTVTFNVWDATGTAASPGSVIATATELTANIATDISNGQETYIDFGGVSLPANGQFYVGFELNYANGDTLAILTNTDGDTSPATAWEEWSGGAGWYAYDDASAWQLDVAHLIFPVVCEASTVTCTPEKDIFEPNESLAAAAELPRVGVNMNAKICDLNDEDWYAIEVDAAKPKVRIEFGGLASNDFSAELYDGSGSLVASSMMTAAHEEAILYNNASAGTYYVRVYGVNGAFSDRGYYLRYTARSSNFAIRAEAEETVAIPHFIESGNANRGTKKPMFEEFIEESFNLYPNPATDFVTVDFSLLEGANVQLRVVDMYGKVVETQSIKALKGNNQQILDLSSLAKGVYFVELYTADQKWSQKVTVVE